MSDKAKNALAIYKSVEGQEEGVGDWLEIDQDRINMFADATLDHQFIQDDQGSLNLVFPNIPRR